MSDLLMTGLRAIASAAARPCSAAADDDIGPRISPATKSDGFAVCPRASVSTTKQRADGFHTTFAPPARANSKAGLGGAQVATMSQSIFPPGSTVTAFTVRSPCARTTCGADGQRFSAGALHQLGQGSAPRRARPRRRSADPAARRSGG